MEMEMEMTTEMEIVIATKMPMSMAMEMELRIKMNKADSVVIPQIPLELHNYGHMERQEMNCTLVVNAAILTLATKGLSH